MLVMVSVSSEAGVVSVTKLSLSMIGMEVSAGTSTIMEVVVSRDSSILGAIDFVVVSVSMSA